MRTSAVVSFYIEQAINMECDVTSISLDVKKLGEVPDGVNYNMEIVFWFGQLWFIAI